MEDKKISKELLLSHAPHIRSNQSTEKIMWLVTLALLPSAAYSVYICGLHALLVILTAAGSAALAEVATRLLLKRPFVLTNGSAVLTGLLLSMNVSPNAPLWMVSLGSIFSIVIAKELFGGLGFNIFNPALAGRAFMMASWPALMTTNWHNFGGGNSLSAAVTNVSGMPEKAYDIVTGATPLAALKEMPGRLAEMGVSSDSLYNILFSNSMLKSLAIGNIGGCIGETSAILLLLGAAFLLYKKIITWHIPFAYLAAFSAVILSYYLYKGFPYPGRVLAYHLLSGGLILGAFFMATDMVTSPLTRKGMVIFGAGCGIIASLIRLWGGYPEGVSYSILLMNAVVPLIDRWTKPRVFGSK